MKLKSVSHTRSYLGETSTTIKLSGMSNLDLELLKDILQFWHTGDTQARLADAVDTAKARNVVEYAQASAQDKK